MKKKIEDKIQTICKRMVEIETTFLYWMNEEWKMLHAQRQILGEILKEL